MRITTYRTELDKDLHTILVKDHGFNYPKENLNNPKEIVKMFNTLYRLNQMAEEHLYLLALNCKCRVLGVFELSHGTATQTICNPREIFIRALLCGASSIILVHNHPSQDVSPSAKDFDTFRQVKDVSKLLGIELLDSIIVGQGYYSFKECKMEGGE